MKKIIVTSALLAMLGAAAPAAFAQAEHGVHHGSASAPAEAEGPAEAGPSDSSAAPPEVVSVRAWATILQQDPDASVVTDAEVRARIAATGYPWLVRHEASGIEFVLIPPGEYMRGASPGDADADSDEKPAHKIVIEKPFYLARTEVTNQQYRTKVAGHDSGKYRGEVLNEDQQPAVMMSWTAADEYCRNLGPGFRLPEEWEWEYACRAGTTTRYPWGDLAADRKSAKGRWLANISYVVGKKTLAVDGAVVWDDGFSVSAPVGNFPANGFGLRDMIGNAWEWCETLYDANEYDRAKDGRPSPPDSTSAVWRVLRGGS